MKRLIAAAVLSMGMVGMAQASTVGGTSTGTWTGETADGACTKYFLWWCKGGVGGASIDDKTLAWPGESWGKEGYDGPYSTMTINDGAFGPDAVSDGDHVTLFSITWVNASTPAKLTDDAFSAFASFLVSFTEPGGGSGSEDLKFGIRNTDNPEGDRAALLIEDGTLDFGGLPRELGNGISVVGYSWMLSGAGSFGTGDGKCGLAGYWCNPEGGTSTLSLKAEVSVIPLPAAGWLLVAGLGGLAAMSRRKKMAA